MVLQRAWCSASSRSVGRRSPAGARGRWDPALGQVGPSAPGAAAGGRSPAAVLWLCPV